MLIEEIPPVDRIRSFCKGRFTVEKLRDPITCTGAVGNSWMRICDRHQFDPKCVNPFYAHHIIDGERIPLVTEELIAEIEKMIGQKFLHGFLHSEYCCNGEKYAEVCVIHTYPNVLHLGHVQFMNLNQPIPEQNRRYSTQTHKGLGLLPTLIDRMKTYAKENGVEWLTLTASEEDLVPIFQKNGFGFSTYPLAQPFRHMELRV